MRIEALQEVFHNKTKLNFGIISDTHFAIHKKSNVFFPHVVKTIDTFINLCIDNDVDMIIHTGDVFDTKHQIATEGLINTNDLVSKMSESFPTILLAGNHDFASVDNRGLNLVSNYKNYSNIVVVFSYEKLVLPNANLALHFLPYYHNPKPFLDEIKKCTVVEKNVLFSHMGVAGFKMHENASDYANQLSAQVTSSKLKSFDKVFLGHYHGYQSKEDITYVSAPLQSRHGDEASKHGFVFWESDKKRHKFIENKDTPKFITYILTRSNVEKMSELKNHYIRIIVNKRVSKELLIALKRKLLKTNYDVSFNFDIKDDSKLAVVKGWAEFVMHDPDKIIIDYVNKLKSQNELEYDVKDLLKIVDIDIK